MRTIGIVVALVSIGLARLGTAIAETSRSIEKFIDATLRWLVASIPSQQPALALDTGFGSLDPQPGNHPISLALYNHNRHEAYGHAKAAHRGV